MKRNKLITLLAAGLLATSSSFAQITNTSFDINLTGWTTQGDVAVRDAWAYLTTAVTPAPFDDGAISFNFSGTTVVDAFSLEGFAGLLPGELDPDSPNSVFAFEGSAIQQTFNVQAGDFINFNWQLLTNENGGNDYAFVVIDGVLTTLGTSAAAAPTGSYGFAEQTGAGSFQTAVYASAQTVTLTLGIVDAGLDGSVSSALRVEYVAVPEPSTFALLGLAAFAVVLRKRRKA